jgi:hypothetical protein
LGGKLVAVAMAFLLGGLVASSQYRRGPPGNP